VTRRYKPLRAHASRVAIIAHISGAEHKYNASGMTAVGMR